MSTRRWLSGMLWLSAAVPPLLCLLWIWLWASSAPEPELLRRILGLGPLVYEWQHAAEFPGEPGFFLFRILYLALLSLPGADFGHAAFLGWVLAGLCCLLLRRLCFGAHGLVSFTGPYREPAAMLVCTLWCFAPTFGADWLLGERFRIFVPPLCLLFCLRLLRSGQGFAWRYWVAVVLAQAAIFTERAGVLVWIGLAPLIYCEARRRGRPRPGLTLLFWLVFGNLGSLLCYLSVGPEMGFADQLLLHPSERLAFLYDFQSLGLPAVFPGLGLEQSVTSGLLLCAVVVLFAALYRRRRNQELLGRAMPYVVFCVYGLCQSILLCHRHLVAPIPFGWLRELIWPGLFLPLGVLGLVAVRAPKLSRLAFPVVLSMLVLLLLQDWHRGFEHLKISHSSLRQGEAQLVFLESATTEMPEFPPPAVPQRKLLGMLRQSGYLRALAPVGSMALSELPLRTTAQPFEMGTLLEVRDRVVRGEVRAAFLRPPPDLVLLTRHSAKAGELILKIGVPVFDAGGKVFPFEVKLSEAVLYRPGDELRAYGFDVDEGCAWPLAGRYKATEKGFERAKESGR